MRRWCWARRRSWCELEQKLFARICAAVAAERAAAAGDGARAGRDRRVRRAGRGGRARALCPPDAARRHAAARSSPGGTRWSSSCSTRRSSPTTLRSTREEQSAADHHRAEHGRQEHYLRQVALIVLMAQIGSFVPADAAEIGWWIGSSPASARRTTSPPARAPSWSR